MGMNYYGIEQDVEYYRNYSMAMPWFTYFYYVEAALKIFAMGTQYFQVVARARVEGRDTMIRARVRALSCGGVA